MDIIAVADRSHHADEHTYNNHAEPEPGPDSRLAGCGSRHGGVLPDPERESGDQEAEPHQGDGGAHPGEEGPLGREIDARIIDRPGAGRRRRGAGRSRNVILIALHQSITAQSTDPVPNRPSAIWAGRRAGVKVAGTHAGCSGKTDWDKTLQ